MTEVAKQYKAKAGNYDGELKTAKFQVIFTQTGLDKLDALAAEAGVSRSEFLERLVRWTDAHWDTQLKRDLSND